MRHGRGAITLPPSFWCRGGLWWAGCLAVAPPTVWAASLVVVFSAVVAFGSGLGHVDDVSGSEKVEFVVVVLGAPRISNTGCAPIGLGGCARVCPEVRPVDFIGVCGGAPRCAQVVRPVVRRGVRPVVRPVSGGLVWESERVSQMLLSSHLDGCSDERVADLVPCFSHLLLGLSHGLVYGDVKVVQ